MCLTILLKNIVVLDRSFLGFQYTLYLDMIS